MKKIMLLTTILVCLAQGVSAQTNADRTYLEINGGLAQTFVGFDFFPGVSFLIGKQKFIAPQTFLEYQVGLALPSVATAKIGIGYQGENIGLSTGVRIFPSYVYGQIHAKTNKGQVSFSFEKSPFSDANFEIGPSFGTSHIFTIGYQWHIGKSRALNRG